MNNILGVRTPAEGIANVMKPAYTLENHAFCNARREYWNLPVEALYEEAVFRGEAVTTEGGALTARTGTHTARSASDKFIVREAEHEGRIWWGQYNRPMAPDKFELMYSRVIGYAQGKDLFVQDLYAGADRSYRLPVRIITEHAWQSLFIRNMLQVPDSLAEVTAFVPEFTIVVLPGFKAMPSVDGTATETFICLSFGKKLAVIGNTAYAGEIKKSVFTVLNYLLPVQGVLSMHCAANMGRDRDKNVALFFGLSGTGKTTLSADPQRDLIGDDEHGWSDEGIFNIESGCYAKVIGLSADAEPQIFATTRRFGTVLENVVHNPVSRQIDLADDSVTENTRACYPLRFIGNLVAERKGGHPRDIIFLTCDASGVMPPIARLNVDQALYQFISGYTSKVGGTEIGMRAEPEITFSACFGGPFMVHPPETYARILRSRIERNKVRCWLVNTGWVGGPYGVGTRISIKYTRALLSAALDGKLESVKYRVDPVFGFEVPTSCAGVPDDLLVPAGAWESQSAYDSRYRELAMRFQDNFAKFRDTAGASVVAAGPRV